MDFSKMTIPDFRHMYRKLRENTMEMTGKTAKKFDEDVKAELEYREMNPTPQNYVICAQALEQAEYLNLDMEEEYTQISYNSWMAAREDKYDFNKENA